MSNNVPKDSKKNSKKKEKEGSSLNITKENKKDKQFVIEEESDANKSLSHQHNDDDIKICENPSRKGLASAGNAQARWIVWLPKQQNFDKFSYDPWVKKENIAEMAFGYGKQIAKLAQRELLAAGTGRGRRKLPPPQEEDSSSNDEDDEDENPKKDDDEEDEDENTYETQTQGRKKTKRKKIPNQKKDDKMIEESLEEYNNEEDNDDELLSSSKQHIPFDCSKIKQTDCFIFIRLATRMRSSQFPDKPIFSQRWPWDPTTNQRFANWVTQYAEIGLKYHPLIKPPPTKKKDKGIRMEALWKDYEEGHFSNWTEFLEFKCCAKGFEDDAIFLLEPLVQKWFEIRITRYTQIKKIRAECRRKQQKLEMSDIKTETTSEKEEFFQKTNQKSYQYDYDSVKDYKSMNNLDSHLDSEEEEYLNAQRHPQKKGPQSIALEEEGAVKKSKRKKMIHKEKMEEGGHYFVKNNTGSKTFQKLDTKEIDKRRRNINYDDPMKNEAQSVMTFGGGDFLDDEDFSTTLYSLGTPTLDPTPSGVEEEDEKIDFKSLSYCTNVNNLPLVIPHFMRQYKQWKHLKSAFPDEEWSQFLKAQEGLICELWEDTLTTRHKEYLAQLLAKCNQSSSTTLFEFKKELAVLKDKTVLEFVKRNEQPFLDCLKQKREQKQKHNALQKEVQEQEQEERKEVPQERLDEEEVGEQVAPLVEGEVAPTIPQAIPQIEEEKERRVEDVDLEENIPSPKEVSESNNSGTEVARKENLICSQGEVTTLPQKRKRGRPRKGEEKNVLVNRLPPRHIRTRSSSRSESKSPIISPLLSPTRSDLQVLSQPNL